MKRKKCSQCHELKAIIDFHKNRNVAGGRASICKQCDKKYRDNHKEEISKRTKEYMKEYRHSHKKQISRKMKEWKKRQRQRALLLKDQLLTKRCSICKEVKLYSDFNHNKRSKDGYANLCRSCKKQYYLLHRREIQSYGRDYYHLHRAGQLIKMRKFYSENKDYFRRRYQDQKERLLNLNRLWSKTRDGKISITRNNFKRRALLQSCKINDLTLSEIENLLNKSSRCPICGWPFNSMRKKSIDHITPLSKGGNNTLLNMQVICLPCNASKGTQHYSKFNNGQMLLFTQEDSIENKNS